MDTSISAHRVDLLVVKKETPHHSNPLDNSQQLNEKMLSGAQNGASPSNVLERASCEHQSFTQHRDGVALSEEHKRQFIQQDGTLCSLSSLKKRLVDRERQRRHRERIRADPKKQQAYRDKERQRYQRRKNMVSALPKEMPTDSQCHGQSGTEYHMGPTGEDHSHPDNYVFLAVSQNSDTENGNMARMDNIVMKRLTAEADAVVIREQIKEKNPVSRLLRVTEKETHEHLFSTQHRGAVFGSQDVSCYFVQQNLCSLMRLKKRLMDRERQRRYRERIRSDPVKQSDDEKERRRVMDRERQRRRRERIRAESNQQQAYEQRERQRLLDRERQRRCRQRLQADPVRWKAYQEKERCRTREAARRSRAKKSLAKALTGWISVGTGGL